MESLTHSSHLWFPSPSLTCILCIFIVATCLLGDHLLAIISTSQWDNSTVYRAITDSLTHSIIGGLVWMVVENSELFIDKRKWLNCFLCAVMAASVDVDHFLAAGSLELKKALTLQQRPPFHNTSLIPLLVFVFWTMSNFRSVFRVFSLMFIASWLSHHVRDANHRGLWLAPFGHTPVIPSYLYISIIVLLALLIRVYYSFPFHKTSVHLEIV